MFDIGFSELLLFGVIALIVLGPEKLPQAARTAGQWYAKMRRAAATIQSEIEAELDLAETRQQMQEELAKLRQTREDMTREMAEVRGDMKAFENAQNKGFYHHNSSNQTTADHTEDAATADEKHRTNHQPTMMRPWENMWFRLGAYDKARRLPPAPHLPNYQADILLYNTANNVHKNLSKSDSLSPQETEK